MIIVFVDITNCILASKWYSRLKRFEITLFFSFAFILFGHLQSLYDGIIDVQISVEEKKQLSETSNPAILTIMTMTLIYMCWIEKWHFYASWWDGRKIVRYSPTFQYINMWMWLCATNIAIAAALLKQLRKNVCHRRMFGVESQLQADLKLWSLEYLSKIYPPDQSL